MGTVIRPEVSYKNQYWIVATVIGVAASTLSSYVEEKMTDAKIEEKVKKALAEAKTETSTEE